MPSTARIPLRSVARALVLSFGIGCAQDGGSPASRAPSEEPVTPPRLEGLSDHGHPITTRSPEAQAFFDQGLRLLFAFNYDEATLAFEECTRLDPDTLMCFWGIGFAAGPNYNSPVDPEREARAWRAIQNARSVSGGASERERGYVDALAARHANPPPADRSKLDLAYANAMRELASRHPEDLDARVLHAEALMNLRPWDLYDLDGTPRPGTEEIVEILEEVLEKDPGHPGANHYYIHAVEASKTPERALTSAGRLADLAPGAGHLVHMPSHVHMRVGDYEKAVAANERAIDVDRAYLASRRGGPEYRMLYYPHNIDFLWAAAAMDGQSGKALEAARELARENPPEMLAQMPAMEYVGVTPLFVLLRFGRFEEVLAEPAPDPALAFNTAIWHYARGLASLRTGRIDDARAELAKLEAAAAAMPAERLMAQVNSARALLEIASHDLAGELAAAEGHFDLAIRELRQAVALQDRLRYMEPPPWYFPERQALGAVLLRAGRPKQAEAVYREDLARNPGNGWALYGLAESLRAQKKRATADDVEAQFREAWARSDVTITASRL
jgi:tetratricopeptide (TPR) repeat protein